MKCKICNQEILNRRKHAVYCSEKCRRKETNKKAKEYRKAHLTESRARDKFNYQVADKIGRPTKCSVCGEAPKTAVHGHHEDYSKPLKVIWACVTCHKRIHKVKKLSKELFKDPKQGATYKDGKVVPCKQPACIRPAVNNGYCEKHTK